MHCLGEQGMFFFFFLLFFLFLCQRPPLRREHHREKKNTALTFFLLSLSFPFPPSIFITPEKAKMSVTKVVAAPLRYYVLAPKPRWNIPLLTQTFGWGIIPSVLTITHDALPEDVEDDEEHYRLQKVAVGAVADVHGEPCRLMGAKTQEMWRLESDDGPLEAHPFDVVLGERTSSAFLSHRGLNTVTGRSALEWVYPTPAESCEVIAASPRSRMGVAVDPNLSVRDCYTIGYEALQADTDWEAYPWASLMRQAHLEGHVHIAAVCGFTNRG